MAQNYSKRVKGLKRGTKYASKLHKYFIWILLAFVILVFGSTYHPQLDHQQTIIVPEATAEDPQPWCTDMSINSHIVYTIFSFFCFIFFIRFTNNYLITVK